jgi:anaerobic magnesium-protoporphyrin IX monomethyl ester cyclase
MVNLDILFVVPSSSKKAYQKLKDLNFTAIETPTWALLLSASMKKFGFNPAILDIEAENLDDSQSIKTIKDHKARLICFVLYGQNPNSGTTSMIGAINLATKIKEENIESKICFVGSHVSALPEEVLNYKFVDFVLINEGVYALRDLLKTDLKNNLNKCRGIGFKDSDNNNVFTKPSIIVPNDRMDVDLPGYAWELLPKRKKPLDLYRAHYWHSYFSEKDRSPFAAIYSSLGCQFGCNFCMINILNRTELGSKLDASNFRGMRFWSPNFFLNELDKLHNFGVKTLRLSDEMFFLNRKYYEPILKGIIERKYDFNMWAYARVDTVRKDQLELFKKAGVNWLCLGIEAGNQNVRMDIEKGRFKEINIREIVKMIKDHGINVLGNYIFGFPEDNFDTMQETLDLAIELNCEHANFYACQALPGSPLYNTAISKGWDMPSKFEEYAFLSYDCKPLPTNYLTNKEVLKFRDKAWNQYFSNSKFLNLIENKFGIENRKNVEALNKVELKRKILEN